MIGAYREIGSRVAYTDRETDVPKLAPILLLLFLSLQLLLLLLLLLLYC